MKMTTIEDQILQAKRNIKADAFYESECLDANKAILASLERLQKIDGVQVPDEPTKFFLDGGVFVLSGDYDTLRDLLRRVTAERDACAQLNDDQSRRVFAAEAELAETKRDAARYRWLRNHPMLQQQAEIDVRQFKFPRATWAQIAYDELDAAIDAAIKELK